MRRIVPVLVLIALVGCRDGGKGAADSGTDASNPGDASDASNDGDANTMAASCTPLAADHVEMRDATNDAVAGQFAEQVTATLSTTSATRISGCFDADASDDERNVDSYSVVVGGSGPQWVIAQLEAPGAANPWLAQLAIQLDGEWAHLANIGATGTTPIRLHPGTHIFSVRKTAAIEGAYRIVLWTATCSASSTSYGESMDGPSNQGNDAYQPLSLEAAPRVMTPTASGTAEWTGIVLEPGTPIRLGGLSEDLALKADGFRDRDSFRLTAGQSGYVLVHATWASASDSLYTTVGIWTPELNQEHSLQWRPLVVGLAWPGLGISTPTSAAGGAITPNAAEITVWVGNGATAGAAGTTYTVDLCLVPFTAPEP